MICSGQCLFCLSTLNLFQNTTDNKNIHRKKKKKNDFCPQKAKMSEHGTFKLLIMLTYYNILVTCNNYDFSMIMLQSCQYHYSNLSQ